MKKGFRNILVALTFQMQCRLIGAQYKLSLLKDSLASSLFLLQIENFLNSESYRKFHSLLQCC